MRAIILFLLFCCAVCVSAVTHSLQYFYIGSSEVPSLPEFVVVGMIDDVQMIHYNSNTRRAVPKQDWMSKVTEDDPQYWDTESRGFSNAEQVFRNNTEIAKHRFNQTGGIHVVQLMYGCEWDDELEDVRGYHQYGYDGEDFITFDVNTETWITPAPQAVMTKNKWDRDADGNTKRRKYLTQDCVDWLKKYVDHGQESLRTVLPSVSLLQKTPSSPVICHATGFYPQKAEMFWRKDGVEIHEGVEKGEIFPNNDGTFQMSVYLDLRSVIAEDWKRYDCVFQLFGVNEDIVTKLEKAVIKTSETLPGWSRVMIILIVTGPFVVLFAVTGLIICGKKTAKCSQTYSKTSSDHHHHSRENIKSKSQTIKMSKTPGNSAKDIICDNEDRNSLQKFENFTKESSTMNL